MPSAGFEPEVAATKRPHTHAVDRAATEIGKHCAYPTCTRQFRQQIAMFGVFPRNSVRRQNPIAVQSVNNIPDDENEDDCRNVGLLAVQPLDTADRQYFIELVAVKSLRYITSLLSDERWCSIIMWRLSEPDESRPQYMYVPLYCPVL